MSTGVRAVKKSVETEEEQTHLRMLLDFLSKWSAGRLGEEEYEKFIFSEFSLLFATLCESYEQIRDPYPSAAAIRFMGEKLQSVPCARLNIQLWKRYALQIAGRPPRAGNAHLKVDHMARDVTAASSHFPYCSAVFHDRELLHLCRATADPSLQDVRSFSMGELADFRNFVELAHSQAERPVSIETIHVEIRRHTVGKLALAAIPSALEPLAERYRHPEFRDVEPLPGGGLLISRPIEGPAGQTVREAFLPLLERLIQTKRLAAPGTLFLFLYATTTSGPLLIQCLDVFAGMLSIADSSRFSDNRLEVHLAKRDVKA